MQNDRVKPNEDSQFRILKEISQQITSILDINELLVQVVRLIQRTFNYYHVGIGLIENDEVIYRVGAGALWDDPDFHFEPGRLKIGSEGLTGWVAHTGEPALVPDVSQDPHYVWMQGSLTKSELMVPINVKGKTIGVLDVQSEHVSDFQQADLELMQAIASQAGIAIENARLFAISQHRTEQFRVLTEVSQHIISLASVDELLNRIAKLVRDAFGYIHVGIGLVTGDQVVSKAEVGAFEQAYHASSIPLGEGIWGRVAQDGASIMSNLVNGEKSREFMRDAGIHSHLCVPLKIKDKVIGVMSAASDQVYAFDKGDEVILQILSNQVSVAIENARLYDQARHLAVLDERQRLSRELHDSVTQSLYGISLYAQAARGNINAGQVEQAGAYLEDIQNTAQESLADMRLLIYELRPPILDKEGLVAALQHRLISVEDRARIKSSIQSNLGGRLPAEVEECLYQITREALNNIIKHARARNVSIRIQKESESVLIEISDDGVGFEPETARRAGSLGLVNMQELALSRGWRLEIESSPGNGTRIIVEAGGP